MSFVDLILISFGNLWRMKLRTFLTMSGVVIAIAAFVAMLSFGAGMQKMISDNFNSLGLFNTIVVYPERAEQDTDPDKEIRVLDDTALDELAKIPDVLLAYPFDVFNVQLTFNDSTFSSQAQALPQKALETKLFSDLKAGQHINSDSTSSSAKEIIVTQSLIDLFGLDSAQQLVDQTLIVSAKISSIDSALINIVRGEDYNIFDRIRELQIDSIFNAEYRERTLKKEVNNAISRFIDGYMNKQETISDTLIIKGVLKDRDRGRISITPVILPMATARLFKESNAGMGNPADMMSLMKGGSFFAVDGEETNKNYSKITLDIEPNAIHSNITDSVKALGFRPFSFAEEFDEVRKAFRYFNMGLGIIGLIALITASLAIVNTMVFSIIERRKEIGVLKSLGADQNHIKGLFLVESSLIGALGASLGILFGWIITRIVSAIVMFYMEREGVDPIDVFALPLWLILSAFVVGIIVSLLAGYFPSARAAKIDAVEALRNE